VITGRGWWTFLTIAVMLWIGVVQNDTTLVVVGMTLLVWLLCEWLFFALRFQGH
jgi:hypothetical protein